MKKSVLILSALILISGSAWAQYTQTVAVVESTQVVTQKVEKPRLFRGLEFQLDLFGTLAYGESVLDEFDPPLEREDEELGLGVGLNFFFARYFGIGGDAWAKDTGGTLVDNASGSLIFRLPFDKIHLAPYAFAGGGYQFEPGEDWFVHAGLGLEVRITHCFGLFADARWAFPEHGKSWVLGRAGFRFAF